ncbi:MAG TPA: hypothetical protein VMV09_06770, partial [Candidatus Saccharimonadales bacterium]|nr:hypothetical protein [Candidatus Saccharimonadales bacterium]
MNRWLPQRTGLMVGIVVVISMLIGGVTAVVSSPGSLTGRTLVYSPPTLASSPSPSALPTPTPTPLTSGTLSGSVILVASGTTLTAVDSAGARVSSDQGLTWSAPNQPKGASGVIIDRGNPRFRLVGGPSLLETSDAGITWKGPKVQPPGVPPFSPLLVNPSDTAVWFVVGGRQLLRTRDGGLSWRALAGLPAVSSPQMAAMAVADGFVLAIGGQLFELLDNGNQVKALPGLPSGSAVHIAVVGAGDPSPVLAVTDTGHTYLLRSGTWSEVPGGLTGPVDGLPSGRAWLGDGGHRLGSPGQLLVTADGGGTWTAAT